MLSIMAAAMLMAHPSNALSIKTPLGKAVQDPQGKHAVYTGTVKWYNADKGYGFISRDDGGPDVFVHHSQIVGHGYRILYEGQRVSFEITMGPKGLQAHHVQAL